jgi:hypothetical protein
MSQETYADLVLRVALSPVAQANAAAAPAPTRQQLDIIRTACASATAGFRTQEPDRVREKPSD